jgi:membrane protein
MDWIRNIVYLLKETFKEFNNSNLIHFAASLSFYILISMPSIVYVLIISIGSIIGHTLVTSEINDEIVNLVGKERADGIQQIILKTSSFNSDPVIKIISLLFLLFTSTGVFIAIQDTLGVVWKVRKKKGAEFLKIIQNRLLSFLMTIVVAFIFILLMLTQALLAAFSRHIKEIDISMIVYLNALISFVVYTFLFALIIKLMSLVKLSWKSLWPGSIGASLFFMLGKFILIEYLSVMDYNYTYAAGAVIIILSWIFYSSYVFCFAAEFTQVQVQKAGHSVILKPYTVKVETIVVNGS